MQVFARSSKFSLFDPAKEMVYIEMSAEEKAQGKAAVDLLGSQVTSFSRDRHSVGGKSTHHLLGRMSGTTSRILWCSSPLTCQSCRCLICPEVVSKEVKIKSESQMLVTGGFPALAFLRDIRAFKHCIGVIGVLRVGKHG
jgi:hypothetical protein